MPTPEDEFDELALSIVELVEAYERVKTRRRKNILIDEIERKAEELKALCEQLKKPN